MTNIYNEKDPHKNDRLEDALKQAFRRQDAPEGFADRVLARIDTAALKPESILGRKYSWFRFFPQPALRWAAAAALSAAIAAGGIYYRHVQYVKAERERAQGEAAKQQLVLALRIAGSKLQLAKSKVTQINQGQGNVQHLKE